MRIVSRVGIGKNPGSVHHLDVTGSVNFDSRLYVQNNVFLNANVDLGDTSADLISFNGRAATSIIPNTDQILNFGSSLLFWQNTYSKNLIIKNAGSIESDGGTINIGTINSSTVNIGKTGTTVNIYGTVNKIQSTDTQVFDKLITLNKNGLAASAGSSGFEIEENSIITAYIQTSSDRNEWLFKAPNKSGIISLAPGSSAFTHKILSQATANRIWTLPDNTDTFVGTDNAQTLQSKTLNNTTTTGTLTVNSTNTINGATTVNNTITSNSSATFTGNIGIGTTSPSYKLHTVGTGYFSQDVILAASSGNVGIGTTSPSSKLHISAGDSSLALFGPNSTWTASLVVGASSNQIGVKKAQVIVTDGNLHLDSGTGNVSYINYYSQTNTYINAQGGSVGIGRTTFDNDAWGEAFKLQVNKSVGAKSFQCGDWFRSTGTSGWYNQTYGGGIYMEDYTWVRTYGGKNFYCSSTLGANNIYADTYIQPSAGSGSNGIIFPSNPGGGGGDSTYIKYYPYYGEDCILDISIGNDANDLIRLSQRNPANNDLNAWVDVGWGGIALTSRYNPGTIIINSADAITGYSNVTRFYYRNSSMNFALQYDGNAVIYQGYTARWSSNTVVSDINVKTNIEKYNESGLKIINQLNVIKFNYIEEFIEDQGDRIGFIAQDIEKIIPFAVKNISSEQKTTKILFKEELVPFIVKGMQEQQSEIENCRKRIEFLEKYLKINN